MAHKYNPKTALASYERKIAATEKKITDHSHLYGVFSQEISQWNSDLVAYKSRAKYWRKAAEVMLRS